MAICEIVHAFRHLLPTGQNRLLHKNDYSNIQPAKTFTYIEESILIIVNVVKGIYSTYLFNYPSVWFRLCYTHAATGSMQC